MCVQKISYLGENFLVKTIVFSCTFRNNIFYVSYFKFKFSLKTKRFGGEDNCLILQLYNNLKCKSCLQSNILFNLLD